MFSQYEVESIFGSETAKFFPEPHGPKGGDDLHDL